MKDLVCGMDVDPAKTKHSVVHEGKDYFFCSAGCLEKFRREPGKYLAGGSGGGHEPMESAAPAAPAGKGVEYTCPMHPEIVRAAPGSCPICGMALEPRAPTAAPGENAELRDMTRRFWFAVALTVPLLALVMGDMLPGAPGRRSSRRGCASSWNSRWRRPCASGPHGPFTCVPSSR